MSAKTDLDNALSILDAGITAHVAALKNSHAAAAVAQAAANDETYITGLTAKVLSWADTLSASNPAPMTPAAQVAAQVAAQPAPVFHDPGATPAMIAAAIAAQAPAAPAAPAPTSFAAFEAALSNLITK